jgi:low affinity Fe/Cu permease
MAPDATGPRSATRFVLRSVIDRITDALGHEYTFAIAAVSVATWLLVGARYGLDVGLISLIMNVGTFMMVFAVQHTSSRESRALNLKLDELIRTTAGRNELIGVEAESHGELDERRAQLRAEAAGATEPGGRPAAGEAGVETPT